MLKYGFLWWTALLFKTLGTPCPGVIFPKESYVYSLTFPRVAM